MSNRTLLLELLLEIEEAIRRIERRFSSIQSPTDFTQNDEGLDRLDGISMMLIAISECSVSVRLLISNAPYKTKAEPLAIRFSVGHQVCKA